MLQNTVPNRHQAIIWTNDGLVYLHIYASLSLSELNKLLERLVSQQAIDSIVIGGFAFSPS